MKPTRKTWLLLLAVGSALATWLVITLLRSRFYVPTLANWGVCVVLVGAAIWAIAAGWPVRQYLKGKIKHVDALRAARVAAMGKSAAYGGTLLAGFYGAQTWLAFQDTHPVQHQAIWPAGGATLCALLLLIAGLIVEGFCKLPPPDDEASAGGQREQPAM